jgi:hypothetical protein
MNLAVFSANYKQNYVGAGKIVEMQELGARS